MYISSGSTVNICSVDLSKAFDKMNHHGLFIKLMERNIPENLLILLERWFSVCMTCVKWCNVWSSWFTLCCGICQGGELSPCLFAIYVDGLVNHLKLCGFGCYNLYVVPGCCRPGCIYTIRTTSWVMHNACACGSLVIGWSTHARACT